MPLPAGTRLGRYEILAPIGAGGMGEVYRACDTKLNRDVAIKVLPAALANDADYMARFQREAQVLASLNHPNIAAIYGLEYHAIVMELVEGPSLAERIAQGPIPIEEALPVAKQIAEALEPAHEKGIIHRDLKPGNIKRTPDGIVKVLDFGLAKTADTHPVPDASVSPTLTIRATDAGMILGTAAYMSPEQAAGKPADKRADIWSFGVVLWEMLTGKRLFEGETISHTMAHVLTAPIDFSQLPPKTPPGIRTLLRRCLDRSVKNRLRDIGEARVAIGSAFEPAGPAASPPKPGSLFTWIAAAAIPTLLLMALAFIHFGERAPETPVARFSISAPSGTEFALAGANRAPAVLSPDGKRLVFGASASASGSSQLYVRALDNLAALPLAGTKDASFPFWSPDSRMIGFFADGKLKKIDASGGAAITLCSAPAARGGAWSQEGVIVFAPDNSGPLQRVSEAGGASSPVTSLDQKRKAASHRYPSFLPDGKHFLYVEQGTSQASGAAAAIRAASLDANGVDSKVIFENEFNATYAQGHLLFLHEGTLMAQPFDPKRLSLSGQAVPVAEQVGDMGFRRGLFSASENGVLVFRTGTTTSGIQLDWFDRAGKPLGKLGDPSNQTDLHLSPDGKNVNIGILAPTGNRDIWIYDIARGIKTRFTFDSAEERTAVWSPDGRTIVFNSNRKGHFDLYRKAFSGAGTEELLYTDDLDKYPSSFSPDGKFLLYYNLSGPSTKDEHLWVLPLADGKAAGKPTLFAQTAFREAFGRFSPDGRWIAYRSDESQRDEIYVAPFPGPGGKRQISTAGGAAPIWRPDGKELFYLSLDSTLMAAEVKVKGTVLDVGSVRPLFGPIALAGGYPFDISADGQSFLVRSAPQHLSGEPLTLIQNWTATLRK